MNPKKILAVIFAGLGLCICIGIFFCIYLFKSLPSSYEIKEQVFKSKINSSPKNAERTVHTIEDRLGENSQQNIKPEEIPSETASTFKTSSMEGEQLYEALMDHRRPLSEVCDTLSRVTLAQTGKLNSKELGSRLKENLLGSSSDPLIASIKPVLKYSLSQPAIQNLIEQVKESTSESSSISGKVNFYSTAYQAYQEMISNKENMEKIMDQNYLTMMMGRAVEAKPELAQNQNFMEYCRDLEDSINQGTVISFAQSKENFLKILQEINIDPRAIHFDPNYQTQLQVTLSDKGLQFKGGWMDNVF